MKPQTRAAKAGTSDSSQTGDKITLGLIGPLTGSLAVYGTHNERGVQLALTKSMPPEV